MVVWIMKLRVFSSPESMDASSPNSSIGSGDTFYLLLLLFLADGVFMTFRLLMESPLLLIENCWGLGYSIICRSN
jgi:hypothetical protein